MSCQDYQPPRCAGCDGEAHYRISNAHGEHHVCDACFPEEPGHYQGKGGLTADDVRALRDWAEWMRRHGPYCVGIDGVRYDAEWPDSLADRLEVMLRRQP